MKDLLPRLISGAIFIAIMIAGVLIEPIAGHILFSIIVFIATSEYARLIKLKKTQALILQALAVGLYLLLSLMPELKEVQYFTTAFCIVTLLLGFNRLFFKNEIRPMIKVFYGVIIMSLPFALLCRFLDQGNAPLIIGLFIMLWFNDSMAYVTGRLLGKRKLFESISPKKTWEGFFGGMLFTVIVSYFLSGYTTSYSLQQLILIAILVSSFGTMGDLVESSLKREAGVKDSGNIMPGHGGLFDRFDGLILSVPIIHLFIQAGMNFLN